MHDVEVVKFDSEMRRIAELTRSPKSNSLRATKPLTAALSPGEREPDDAAAEKIDWQKELEPQGAETRIAQAVRQIAGEERGVPVSAMVVISDGGKTPVSMLRPQSKRPRKRQIPVYTIGIGSANRPTNVRVSDLVAPARAYPGDSFQVTGYVQAQGLAGRTVTVEIAVVIPKEGPNGHEESVWDSAERVTLGGDSETVPVRFDVPGIENAGRRVIRLRVKSIAEDKDPTDNQREVDVDIVDRKNRVLLFAGGPSREYQFLRNLLRRSELAKSGEITVDILLQSASDGVSQDANEILDEFPRTMQELSQYDTIVAFDPDWRQLEPAQMEMVEKWVGEESGGLIVVAGPVFTDAWVQQPSMAPIRKLYPVEFNRRLALLEDARYGSTQPWPLEFTREGMEAEFLWLDDNAVASREAWDAFKGVYGYYGVRGPKLGATTYALYSDPEASIGDQKPVYFAGQFYGSGRVFYMGSGEMWRLRDRAVWHFLHEANSARFAGSIAARFDAGEFARGARSVRGRQHGGRASAAFECSASAAGGPQSHAASHAGRRQSATGGAGGRSGAERDVFRPVHRDSGRGVQVGAAASRLARRGALQAVASVHAQVGAGTSGAER